MTELERCDDEIRQMESLLRAGHPDIHGLLLALVDWRKERKMLVDEYANALKHEPKAT